MKRHVFICYAIIALLLVLSACSKNKNPIQIDTESHITDDLTEATTTIMTTALTQETTKKSEDSDPTISSELISQNQQSYLEIIPDSKNTGEVYDEQNGYSFVDISNLPNDIEANRIFFIQASDINDQSIIKYDFNKDNKEDLLVIKKILFWAQLSHSLIHLNMSSILAIA